MTVKLSIIIVNYNGAEFLPQCLNSIRERMGGVAHEVCVVDNASTDSSRDLISHQFPWVDLVANNANLGFAAGVNVGLGRARGAYILWLNPDSLILNDGIVGLLGYLDGHPGVGIIGAKVVNPDGSVQLSCRSFPSFRTAFFNRYSLLTKLFPRNRFSNEYLLTQWDHSTVREVDWVSGACLLHRREVSDAVGGLDERFFMYSEDVDFCLRAARAGWTAMYHPGLHVLHHIGGSSKQVAARMVVERHHSMWRYYAKHFRRNPLRDALVALAIYSRCTLILARYKMSGGIKLFKSLPDLAGTDLTR